MERTAPLHLTLAALAAYNFVEAPGDWWEDRVEEPCLGSDPSPSKTEICPIGFTCLWCENMYLAWHESGSDCCSTDTICNGISVKTTVLSLDLQLEEFSFLKPKLDKHPSFLSGLTIWSPSSKVREYQLEAPRSNRWLLPINARLLFLQGLHGLWKRECSWDVGSGQESKWDTVLLGDDAHTVRFPRW